jgi:signal transduction histidine kinase
VVKALRDDAAATLVLRRICIRIHPGVGGANPSHGSGIIGLSDRVASLGGTLTLRSAPGIGTSMTVELPMRLG